MLERQKATKKFKVKKKKLEWWSMENAPRPWKTSDNQVMFCILLRNVRNF